jgi:hypothetical protein
VVLPVGQTYQRAGMFYYLLIVYDMLLRQYAL